MTISGRAAAAGALPLGAVLALDPGGFAPFGPAKWLAVGAIVPAGVAMLRGGTVRLERRSAAAWAALLVIGAVAAAVGNDRLYAWIGTPTRHFGWFTWVLCALAFVVGQQLDRREARVVAAAGAVAVAGAGAWALLEVAGWHPIALAGAGDRAVGTLGSSAYLGAAAVLLGPLALSIGNRWARLTLGGLAAVALIASGARAAWVGAVVAGVVVLVSRRPSRRAVVALLATSGVAVAAAFVFGVAGRVPDLVHDRDGGVKGRLDEWRVAARVIAAHPLIGVGPEGYRIAFAGHVGASYEQHHGRDPLPDRAHSAPLDVAATLGLPGLLAYGGLVLVAGRFVVRALRAGDAWLATVAAGLVAYAVQSLFLFPLAELDPVAWLLAGLVVAASVGEGQLSEWRVPAAAPVAAGAIAALAVVAGGLALVADRDARSTVAALADERLPRGDRARRLRPDDITYDLVAARAAATRETPSGFADALRALDHARTISPRDPVVRSEQARVQLERARVLGGSRRLAQARTTLAELVADDPFNAEVWLRVGVGAALAGDDGAAERAWLRAEWLAPRSAAAVVDLAFAYERQGRRGDAQSAALRALARDPKNEQVQELLRRLGG